MEPNIASSSDSPIASRRGFLRTAGATLLAAGAVGAAPAIPLAPPDKQPPDLHVPPEPGKHTGWAIVGLGELALNQVLPAIRLCDLCKPTALVSGHLDKARRVADAYGIDAKHLYNYDNFDSIANDPDIDVVYIILPNSMHAEFTIRALKAGKHVLCEKPMAASSGEAKQMIDAAKQASRKLMIAYRLHYEPHNQTMIELSRKQAFGKIQLIEAANLQQVKAPNIRLSKKLAGGALMDVGVYCINATRYLTNEEPAEVSAAMFSNPDDPRFAEVDEHIVWTTRFPSGILATCSASFGTHESRRLRVNAAKGWYELDPAFGYDGLTLKTSDDAGRHEPQVPKNINHFAKEMDHFADCVLHDKQPWTPGEEGLADLRVVEAIYQSAQNGKPVKLG